MKHVSGNVFSYPRFECGTDVAGGSRKTDFSSFCFVIAIIIDIVDIDIGIVVGIVFVAVVVLAMWSGETSTGG